MRSTNHPKIISFYNANPQFSFETMNLLIIDMVEKMNFSNELLQNNKSDMNTVVATLQHLCSCNLHTNMKSLPSNNCDYKLTLHNMLTKMFPIADIKKIKTAQDYQTSFMKRFRKQPIYLSMMNNVENVSKDQMVTSLNDFGEFDDSSAIFISQQSGFVDKDDFHVDIHNNNIIVYIHNNNDVDNEKKCDEYKIGIAIQMIDHFMGKWNEIKYKDTSQSNGVYISKEIMGKINNEYQLFLHQKITIRETIKETQKKLQQLTDDMKFPFLEGYLSTQYNAPMRSIGLKCDVCSKYNANNLKALAAHKRGCLRKHPSKIGVENIIPNQIPSVR